MATAIGFINITSGKFFIKDASGDVIQLQQGDIITEGMLVFGDKDNSASDSVIIKTSTGVTITLYGEQEQLFDASTIEAADAMDGAVAVENIQATLVEIENVATEPEAVLDESDAEDEDKPKSEDDGEVVIAARSGEVVDIESETRDNSFPEETAAGEDESQKNTDQANVLLDRANPFVNVVSSLGDDSGYVAPASITNDLEQPIPEVVNPTIVTDVNNAPVAVDDVITATEDTPFTSTIDLDANDTDLDGDALTVVAGTFTTAQGGEIVIATDGSYTYTPALNFNGTDTVDYTVTDGALTDIGTLTITVDAVNDAATVSSETKVVSETDAAITTGGTL
nr:Ig-like domain-containing protein [Helicobacteraceae bacterium]